MLKRNLTGLDPALGSYTFPLEGTNSLGARTPCWKYEKNMPEIDHIFPKATLLEQKFDETEVNHFANFWILAKNKNRNKTDSLEGF